ncbi:DUF6053 domain-containing protein [Lysobacter enzymogenes]|uniref:DUF6053 domain-containing protein n=1 Tax=Lysobacter enzymogenes TaxID=69 RepID=UPI003D18B714
MGGTSVPTLSAQCVAIRNRSVGTEVPRTKAGAARSGRATLRPAAASMHRHRLAAASPTRSN